jgi:hypothetical protein
LVTTTHVAETRQLSNHLIHELGDEGFAVLFQLVWLQSESQLFFRSSGIDDVEFPHEHDHCINQGHVAVEAVRRSFTDVIKELMEWDARHQDLEDRVHVAHVASVDKSAWLEECNLVTVTGHILTQATQDICERLALLNRKGIRVWEGRSTGGASRILGSNQISPGLGRGAGWRIWLHCLVGSRG